MKTKIFILFIALGMAGIPFSKAEAVKQSIEGAWKHQAGGMDYVAVFVDGYFSLTTYDLTGKKFVSTRGGTYDIQGDAFTVVWQYDTDKAAQKAALDTWLGQTATFSGVVGNNLQSNMTGQQASWTRLDSNGAPLTGVWRMSGRKQGDEITDAPLRDRRTLKILTGTRFQWVAINIGTGEFSGTGGGTYTFENGKYTENIEFFSRDNERVGASLEFDAQVIDGKWHHSGLSSVGNPIYEIWGHLEEK